MTVNSVGNVTEILDMLNKDTHTVEELAENYQILIDKWGEWEIIGAGQAGLVVRYVNIANALFSGLMIIFCTLSAISFVCALVFGKLIFPLLSKHYINANNELVDMATLKSATQIDKLSKKEWF